MTSSARKSTSKQPQYRRIEQWLEEQCNALPAGSPLPSESQLVETFKVSRMTIRNAMQELTASGRIERRQGLGTFVGPKELHRKDSVLFSFTEEIQQRGMTATSRLVDKRQGVFPTISVLLSEPSDAWLIFIDRIRLANDRPLARERVYLPTKYAAVLDYDLEQGSLHAALRELGVEFGSAKGTVTARLAHDDDLELLDLQAPSALLVESRIIREPTGAPIEHTETAYIADKWAIDTRSSVERFT